MKFTMLAAAIALGAAAPLAAQTPAPAVPRRPAPQARAARPNSNSSRFAGIREKYRKEIDADRAALQRVRDRMREELTAAGWRPHRGFDGAARMRMARFRSRRMARGAMRPGRNVPPAAMRRPGMPPRPPFPGRGAMIGRGPMSGARGRGMGQPPRPPMMRRPPPGSRPDSSNAR